VPTVMLYGGRIPHHYDDPDERRASDETVHGPERANVPVRPSITSLRWVIPGDNSWSVASRRRVATRLSRTG